MDRQELERGIREAMVRRGWVLPTTVEEVLIAEEAMRGEPEIELPESLRDPYEIMRRHPEVFGRDVCRQSHERVPGEK